MDFISYGRHTIDEDDIGCVVDVLRSNWITTGPKISEFEDEINRYIGSKYCVAVNSGTSALDIAIQSLSLPTGSEIITTPFTFVATSNSILYNNLIPVFVDIERETRNIDPSEIKKCITKKTKAILIVDYAGHACEIDEIKEIAKINNLYLIEDACHSMGGEYRGGKIGNFADMTIFSFHPLKHITTGEGGAVVTNNEEFYKRLLLARNHGIDKDGKDRFGIDADYAYDMKMLGRNYRITDFQCALGINQLKKLDRFLRDRSRLAQIYNELLKDIKGVELPISKKYVKHPWHIYTILLKDYDRDKIFKDMRKRNIGVNVHYIPIYKFSYYKNSGKIDACFCPNTEQIFKEIITLPLHPGLNEDHIKYISENLLDIIK